MNLTITSSPMGAYVPRRRRLDPRRQLEEPRLEPAEAPLGLVTKGALWVCALLALAGGLGAGFRHGFVAGLGFVLMTAVGFFGLSQALAGISSGVVDSTAKDSSERIAFDEHPFRFVRHVLVWIWMGALPLVICLGGLFAS